MKVRRLLIAFPRFKRWASAMAGQNANTRIALCNGSKRKGLGLDAEGGAGALSVQTTGASSAECSEGGSSGWSTTSKRIDRQSNGRYQKLARASIVLIKALGDRRQLCSTA